MLFVGPDGDGVTFQCARERAPSLVSTRQRRAAVKHAAIWAIRRRGATIADIAASMGMTERGVYKAIRATEALAEQIGSTRDPDLMPMFGCRPFAAEYLRDSTAPAPAPEPVCHVCRSAITPNDRDVCMRCYKSGSDFALAESLGAAVVAGLAPTPSPPRAGRPAPIPRLTLAHRIELAKTPQGAIWLESIGQMPTGAEMDDRKARRKARRADRRADRRRSPA